MPGVTQQRTERPHTTSAFRSRWLAHGAAWDRIPVSRISKSNGHGEREQYDRKSLQHSVFLPRAGRSLPPLRRQALNVPTLSQVPVVTLWPVFEPVGCVGDGTIACLGLSPPFGPRLFLTPAVENGLAQATIGYARVDQAAPPLPAALVDQGLQRRLLHRARCQPAGVSIRLLQG